MSFCCCCCFLNPLGHSSPSFKRATLVSRRPILYFGAVIASKPCSVSGSLLCSGMGMAWALALGSVDWGSGPGIFTRWIALSLSFLYRINQWFQFVTDVYKRYKGSKIVNDLIVNNKTLAVNIIIGDHLVLTQIMMHVNWLISEEFWSIY